MHHNFISQLRESHSSVAHKQSRGVSLLIVVLVGSILVLTAVSLSSIAKRSLQSSQSYFESLQDAYTTEDAFECVRQWLMQDDDAFNSGKTITCGDASVDSRNTVTFGSGNFVITPGRFSTSSFTIYTPPGNVEVEVVRDLTAGSRFKGLIYTRGYNVGPADVPRNAERFRVYEYESPGFDFAGVDVMFVIDRSGSILGDRTSPDVNEDWGKLLWAVATSTYSLLGKFPQPWVGYVSFGTRVNDTSAFAGALACTPYAPACDPAGLCCSDTNFNWRIPEVRLTNATNTLLNLMGTPNDRSDDVPRITTTPSNTNLSLGLAVAGMELMGRYYPDTNGVTNIFRPAANNFNSGGFERWVALNTALPPRQPQRTWTDDIGIDHTVWGNDRPDADFPDYIIIVTDGAPNALIRHTNVSVGCTTVPSGVIGATNLPGQTLLFHTGDASSDCYNRQAMSTTASPPDPYNTYAHCNDRIVNSNLPTANGFQANNTSGEQVYPAMCNVTLIAEKLKDSSTASSPNIKIAAIGVGVTTETERWLIDRIVSSEDGVPLYVSARSFEDVPTLFNVLAEKIAPTLFR